MIVVELMNNQSPVNKINKYLIGGPTYDCLLKENTSILRPIIILRTSDNIASYNYMSIGAFGRYYFIDDIRSVHNDTWEIQAHVDVLETYKDAILANRAIIRRQENRFNLYLDDPEFKTFNTEKIQTIKFPANTGFSKTLKYVLTVNGSYGLQNEGGA